MGGTKSYICLATPNGESLAEAKIPTPARDTPERFFELVFSEIRKMLPDRGLDPGRMDGIGFGFPGVVDETAGIVTNAPALSWPAIDVRPLIQAHFGGTVVLDNDVNFAALGEQALGAAQGKKHFAMITVGTGIGGALYLNGQPYKGSRFSAGEAGYMVVGGGVGPEVHAGDEEGRDTSFGALENVTSGEGIGSAAREYFGQRRGFSAILTAVDNRIDRIGAVHVLDAAAHGDEAALHIMVKPLEHMAMAIANIVSLLNPELVVIGGGVASSHPYYVSELRLRVKRFTPIPANIVVAQLGNRAGAIGAIVAVRNKLAATTSA